MTFVSNIEFHQRISTISIGRDPRDPVSNDLVFLPRTAQSRFWPFPQEKKDYDAFFSNFIDLLPLELGALLYPSGGVWIDRSRWGTPYASMMTELLRPLKMNNTDHGAIHFETAEARKLTRILVTLVTESGTLPDATLIPISGQHILFFDHHKALWVRFQNEASINPFVGELTKRGIHLPTDYPDSTFKPVDWMPK
ncbi:MAG TPA: hypothetical protein VL633_06235 [Bacteroidota bacterium]|jgi:hypothetical protein|nr:hypothetical protein [Bacteroidota bacterium]